MTLMTSMTPRLLGSKVNFEEEMAGDKVSDWEEWEDVVLFEEGRGPTVHFFSDYLGN